MLYPMMLIIHDLMETLLPHKSLVLFQQVLLLDPLVLQEHQDLQPRHIML